MVYFRFQNILFNVCKCFGIFLACLCFSVFDFSIDFRFSEIMVLNNDNLPQQIGSRWRVGE